MKFHIFVWINDVKEKKTEKVKVKLFGFYFFNFPK